MLFRAFIAFKVKIKIAGVLIDLSGTQRILIGEICKEQSDGIAKRHVISKMRTSEARAKTLQNRKGRLFFAKKKAKPFA